MLKKKKARKKNKDEKYCLTKKRWLDQFNWCY